MGEQRSWWEMLVLESTGHSSQQSTLTQTSLDTRRKVLAGLAENFQIITDFPILQNNARPARLLVSLWRAFENDPMATRVRMSSLQLPREHSRTSRKIKQKKKRKKETLLDILNAASHLKLHECWPYRVSVFRTFRTSFDVL